MSSISGSGESRASKLAMITLTVVGTLLVLSAFLTLSMVVTADTGSSSAPMGFNQPGNVLVTDQFNNRIIEVSPLTKQIVWSFGSGNPSACNPGPHSIIGSNDAERISGGLTVISGTGILQVQFLRCPTDVWTIV
ncbi:MAG: hypothetical protein ACRDF4_11845 [Rhabdochlamydiaceae bacterium]